MPQCGANIASLYFKPLGKQILYQRPGPEFKRQPYDGVYTDAENAGMDDMFPNIDACACLQLPWEGILLPDHGEVWSLPWDVSQDESGLSLSVHGVRLPYTLKKRLWFPFPNVLRADYQLINHSPFPFDYLWAGHCMFSAEAGTQIRLPDGSDKITLTFSIGSLLGQYGAQHAWPNALLPDGNTRDLSLLRSEKAREVYKYYLNGPVSRGWCAAVNRSSGYALGLSWPAEAVPYLAVLPNEGGWDDTVSLYFEPSTCSFDRPDIGRYRHEVSTLPGKAVHQWYLNFALTTDLDFSHVTAQGTFA